jgi:hypothetical protein
MLSSGFQSKISPLGITDAGKRLYEISEKSDYIVIYSKLNIDSVDDIIE